MKINNVQYGLIFLIIALIIILTFHSLGGDLIINRSKIFKSLVKIEYKFVKENMNKFVYKNYNVYHKIIDETKPYIFIFSPVLFHKRTMNYLGKFNVIEIHYKNSFIKPDMIKKNYLEAFDYTVKYFGITKNIVPIGVCCCTDISLYITHKRSNLVSCVILESAMNKYIQSVNNINAIKWIKFLAKDSYSIDKNFYIPKNILIINYEEEKICPMNQSFMKAQKLKNNDNNVYLFIPKILDKNNKSSLFHAEAFLFDDYIETIQKFINKNKI